MNDLPSQIRPGGRSAVGMVLGLVVCGALGCGCSEEPTSAEKVAQSDVQADITIWADTGKKDSWSPIVDTNAPPVDTWTAEDTPAPLDIADVALPTPVTVPTDLPPDVQAIGVVATDLEEDGKTKVIKVALPQGTLSFLAVVQGAHPGHFTIATAVTPKGDLLGKGQCQPLCTSCKNPIKSAPATGSVLFPNASDVQVHGGSWHLSSCGFVYKQQGNQFSTQPLAKAAVNTYLLARVSGTGELPTKLRLKTRLWFAGTFPNAAQSFDDPKAVVMLAAAATALASAGIALDVIDRIDAAAGFENISVPDGLTTDHSSNADGLIAQAAKIGGSAVLDVFVVQSLSGGKQGGQQVRGWSGGTPGPVGIPGAVRSGVVIALPELDDGATAGRQLAHEIGHYLGLFDTTSANAKHDPINDTAACPTSQDKDGDGLLTAAECVAFDGSNVMFWQPDNKPATFSAEQSKVMRGNPMLWPLP
jgi:hypothetical protein